MTSKDALVLPDDPTFLPDIFDIPNLDLFELENSFLLNSAMTASSLTSVRSSRHGVLKEATPQLLLPSRDSSSYGGGRRFDVLDIGVGSRSGSRRPLTGWETSGIIEDPGFEVTGEGDIVEDPIVEQETKSFSAPIGSEPLSTGQHPETTLAVGTNTGEPPVADPSVLPVSTPHSFI